MAKTMLTKAKFFVYLLVLISPILSGCVANMSSIHRQFNLDDDVYGRSPESQLIDVKQRSILVQKKGENTVVCAEPSPDALSVYATAAALSAQQASGSGASGSFSTSEAGTAFGLRTQSIQLLRDAYYRACEAYLSAAIDEETYDTLIRRLNNQAIAYLAIEQITSAAAKAEQTVVIPPSLEGLFNQMEKAQTDVAAANSNKAKLEEEAKAEADPEKKKQKEALVAEAEKTRKAANDKVASLQQEINAATKSMIVPANKATSGGSGMAGAAEASKEIALEIIRADYSPQMCFAYFKFRETGVGQAPNNSELGQYCKAVLDNFAVGSALRNDAISVLIEALRANCMVPGKDGKMQPACSEIAEVIVDLPEPVSSSIMKTAAPASGRMLAPP